MSHRGWGIAFFVTVAGSAAPALAEDNPFGTPEAAQVCAKEIQQHP